MAIALEVVEKTDEHGKYVEFRLSNNKEYLIKMDLFDFDRIKYNKCYYVHRHVTKGKNPPYVRRAVYENSKMFTTQIHREILLKDPHDKERFISFKDNDSLNIRRYNMEILLIKDVHMSRRKNRWEHNIIKFGVKNISISYLKHKDSFQAYHNKKYICFGKTKDIIEQRIHEYILKNNLKETNGI